MIHSTRLMTAFGRFRTCGHFRPMSAIEGNPDIRRALQFRKCQAGGCAAGPAMAIAFLYAGRANSSGVLPFAAEIPRYRTSDTDASILFLPDQPHEAHARVTGAGQSGVRPHG